MCFTNDINFSEHFLETRKKLPTNISLVNNTLLDSFKYEEAIRKIFAKPDYPKYANYKCTLRHGYQHQI